MEVEEPLQPPDNNKEKKLGESKETQPNQRPGMSSYKSKGKKGKQNKYRNNQKTLSRKEI